MVVLDTDLIISYLRKKENAYDIVQALKERNLPLNTTIFNSAELFKGSYGAKNVAKSLNKIETTLEALDQILAFDDVAVQEYAKLSADLKKRGLMAGTMDELIASICIANNETLYTGNTRHFKNIPKLSFKNWKKLKSNREEKNKSG